MGEGLASDPSTDISTNQLPEGDLWSAAVVDEPPSVPENGGAADVDTDHHVSHKEPWTDERFSTRSRGCSHDHIIWRIEPESSSRQTAA